MEGWVEVAAQKDFCNGRRGLNMKPKAPKRGCNQEEKSKYVLRGEDRRGRKALPKKRASTPFVSVYRVGGYIQSIRKKGEQAHLCGRQRQAPYRTCCVQRSKLRQKLRVSEGWSELGPYDFIGQCGSHCCLLIRKAAASPPSHVRVSFTLLTRRHSLFLALLR